MFLRSALLSFVLPVYGLIVHESLPAVPYGWKESSLFVPDNSTITLQVAIKYQNLDQLESKLKAVSDPASSQYGQYLDREQIDALFGPSQQSASNVVSWLSKSGATSIQNSGDVVSFQTTVRNVDKMLDTNFTVYTDGTTNLLRTTAYSIPEELSSDIDFITPTTYFGSIKQGSVLSPVPPSKTIKRSITKRQNQTQTQSSSCAVPSTLTFSDGFSQSFDLLSPQCLRQIYNVGNYSADPSSGSSVAFASFLEQSAIHSDLAKFEHIWGLPSHDFSLLALINGGVDDQSADYDDASEANLDAQNIAAMSDTLPFGEYITGGRAPLIPDLESPNATSNYNEPYLEYYQYLLSQPNSNLPYVFSVSYDDHENTVPEYYAKRTCNMMGMMGLRGRTILHASGDSGVGAVCRNNEPPNQPQFEPEFPSTCPYVTSVGGTTNIPEQAWNGSAGGFSNYFPTAWYQTDAVNTYLSNHISSSTKEYYSSNQYVNFSGRAIPDIAALAWDPYYAIVIDNVTYPSGGCSGATPVVASVIGLLNDARLRANQPAMGFINPWLYKVGYQGLNDITAGGSVGCNGVDSQTGEVVDGAGIIPYASWNATIGWDPVTGLGSPDFQKLKDLALSRSWSSIYTPRSCRPVHKR